MPVQKIHQVNLLNQRLFAIGFLLYLNTSAQEDSISLKLVNNPILKEYSLRKMCVDKSGKLWFATDKGVLSYDGNDIILFERKEGDSATLVRNSTGRLYPDDRGNIYVFGVGFEAYLNTQTGKVTPLQINIREKDRARLAFPYAFTEPFIDDDESIWVGLYNVGFLHYNLRTKKTNHFPLHDNPDSKIQSVFSIKRDYNDKNILWLATDHGIYSFNKLTRALKRNFRCSTPQDSSALHLAVINMDKPLQDEIWFTVPTIGVGSYEIKTGFYTIYPYKINQTGRTKSLDISYFQRKNNHEYYISAIDNLPGIFNTQSKQYSFAISTSENLPEIQVRHILADSAGNFWSLIFYQLYLARSNEGKLRTFKLPFDKSANKMENAFKTAVWDKNNKCYYAAFDSRNDVFVLDSNKKLIKSIAIEYRRNDQDKKLAIKSQIGTGTGPQIIGKSTTEANIYDMGLDETGRLWLCGSSLWVYDSYSKTIKPAKTKPSLNFEALRFQNFVFRKNNIYLQPSSPSSKAIYRLNYKHLTCDSIVLSSLIINEPIARNHDERNRDILQIDKNEKFAYFSYNSTIFQLDLNSRLAKRVITVSESEKPFQHFFNMFWYVLDDSDNLWVSTISEVKKYEPTRLQLISQLPFEKDSYPIQLCNIEGKKFIGVLYSGGLLLINCEKNEQFKFGLSDGLTTTFNSGLAFANDLLFIGAIDYMHYIPLKSIIQNKVVRSCYLTEIKLFNKPFKTDTLPEFLRSLKLKYNQNFVAFTFSSTEFDQPERLEYRYRLAGVDPDWVYTNYLNRSISYNNLKPGHYTFHASVRNSDGTWSKKDINLSVVITPAWWQTSWFKLLSIIITCAIAFALIRWRIKAIRQQEQQRISHEKELLELEAKALRAQMNPHFIFNSLNSIKSLINKNENEKAASYLTVFSKLIRTLFQNSDRREISLYEELETCKLYTQLEKMRFGDKVDFTFDIDESIDLKDIKVPALILQPFIENAIWHGLVPKETGGSVVVSVKAKDDAIECLIDDDGIGRELSKQYKAQYNATHESKGIGLTRTRLELDKALNNREDTVTIMDKINSYGKPAGTKVVLTFKENAV